MNGTAWHTVTGWKERRRPVASRRKFTEYERKTVYAKADGRCSICGRPIRFDAMTIDHKVPLSKGGTNEISNLQSACEVCNLLKTSYRNPTGFRRWVKVAKSGSLYYTSVMGAWKSKNRRKYLLQYHIIFVCKYRKKLLMSRQISDDIKQFSYEICQKHKAVIRYMETDKDHIHYMIETEPTMSM